jgi:hypothetical protein
MLSSLAREAAELLWEMVATEDIGDVMQQMRENATTVQVLRRPPAAAEQPARRVPLARHGSLQRALTAWLPARDCARTLLLPCTLHAPRSCRCSRGANDRGCADPAREAVSSALGGPPTKQA